MPSDKNFEQLTEGAVAKADLYKLATYSHKLFTQLEDTQLLEGWVQDKISKAADQLANVFHYLEYETKFNQYSKQLNESNLSDGQKDQIRNVLAEAKEKVKELKKAQAEKMKKEKKLDETWQEPCGHCGGLGHVEKKVPEEVKAKVKAYNRKMKASHAAHKRLDANNNGIPDDQEIDEDQSDLKKTGDSYKTKSGGTVTKTSTGIKHEKGDYSDEPHQDAQKEPSKKSMTGAERREQKAQDKKQKQDSKDWQKRFGKDSVTTHKMDEAKKCTCEDDGKSKCKVHGKMEEGKKKGDGNLANNYPPYDKVTRGDVIAGATGKDQKGGKSKKVDEGKPSAGLSAAKKSAVVKKAKAGGDIGKPGKSFDKVAKAAGGGEKGKKIAAAAMWKNIKETVAYIEEKKAAVKKDLPGNQEKIDANHNGKIDKDDFAKLRAGKKTESINESAEVDRIKALTQRLLG
mgnify:CR=1 FL=1